MASHLQSAALRTLVEAVCRTGELIFACGPEGVSANIVGPFAVRRHGDEDRLEMGDGTNHVHVEWERITRVEAGTFQGEGMLTFFAGTGVQFRLYRPEGPYQADIENLARAIRAESNA